MDNGNILSGGLSNLKEYRSLVEEYTNAKTLNEQAASEEKRLEKELKINQKNLEDDIDVTVKRRRGEVASQFDKAIDKDDDKIKKIRGQRSKAKNKGVKARIAEETSDLVSQNEELKANIKTSLREAKLPGFCGSGFYFSLFFTKGFGEVVLCALMIIMMFLIVPGVIYIALPIEKIKDTNTQIVLLAVTYFMVMVLVFFLYMIIGDRTKHKHKEELLAIRSLRDQVNKNNVQIRKIARAIRKDKNEEMYNLGDYDARIKDIEDDIAIITQNKADALKVFDETTKPAIIEEINNRELPRIQEIERNYKDMITKHNELEDTVKQLGIKLSTEYESYVDKSFSNVNKIDELIEIMETGKASTIAEAIQVYKTK